MPYRPSYSRNTKLFDGKDRAVYAVVVAGSKQYRVSVGQTIDVELLPVEAGSDVELEQVLMVGGEGADLQVGVPTVAGAKVVATVTEHHRGDKIIIFKMKAKKRYRRKTGHRQELTRLTIKDIIV
jgi:large subunit ribosomal protein L21